MDELAAEYSRLLCEEIDKSILDGLIEIGNIVKKRALRAKKLERKNKLNKLNIVNNDDEKQE
jgi:hypothetical protein